MSLQLRSSYTVPEETARVTRAAFPKGKAYLRLHEELGALYTDEMCSRLFPSQGQPAESPARSAFGVVVVRLHLEPAVVLVQQAEDLGADIRAAGVLEECLPLERRLGKGGKLRADKIQIQARLCVHDVLLPIHSGLIFVRPHACCSRRQLIIILSARLRRLTPAPQPPLPNRILSCSL